MKVGTCIRVSVATLVAVLSLFSCSKVTHVHVQEAIVLSPTSTSLTKADLFSLEHQINLVSFRIMQAVREERLGMILRSGLSRLCIFQMHASSILMASGEDILIHIIGLSTVL